MDLGRVAVRLYGDLADLAGVGRPAAHIDVPVGLPRSVKDVIESLGVPHTEVDLLLVNDVSVDFEHRVAGGDRVSVYPTFRRLDVAALSRVRPQPLPEARFVLDVHLGGLARRLRLLGFDTTYRNDLDDDALAAIAGRQRRVLLTRDRGLLMRASVTHGHLVRADEPDVQAIEVVARFDLFDALAPFTRCGRCGQRLEPAAKADVADRLEPGTRATYDEFSRCTGCGRIYWPGAHHERLRQFVARVRAARR